MLHIRIAIIRFALKNKLYFLTKLKALQLYYIN